MVAIILLCTLFPALARTQAHGEAEAYISADGTKYFSQFLWEDFARGKIRLMQRWYPADGRKVRWEIGAGGTFALKGLSWQPVLGATSDGYLLTSLVVAGKAKRHAWVYIGDKKWKAYAGKDGYLFQKAFLGISQSFWLRWDGVWLDSNRWANSQPGLEYRKRLGDRLSWFLAGQYDLATKKPVVHTGLRF